MKNSILIILLVLFSHSLFSQLPQRNDNHIFDYCFYKAKNIQYLKNKFGKENVTVVWGSESTDLAIINYKGNKLIMTYDYSEDVNDFTDILVVQIVQKGSIYDEVFNLLGKELTSDTLGYLLEGRCVVNSNDNRYSFRGETSGYRSFNPYFEFKNPEILIGMEDEEVIGAICDKSLLEDAGIYLSRIGISISLSFSSGQDPKIRFSKEFEAGAETEEYIEEDTDVITVPYNQGN